MKKILAITLAALLALSIMGCGKDNEAVGEAEGELEAEVLDEVLEYGNFEYSVNEDGNYEIIGFTYSGQSATTVEIPSEIEGRPVTGIGADAFKAVTAITEVDIPDSIEYIGQFAFFRCTGLTEVTIPDSVKKIETGAFYECSNLEKITLSSKLEAIGNFAFLDCVKLEKVEFPDTLVTIGNGAFWGCTGLTEVTIPANVTSIGDGAFLYCYNVAKLTVDAKEIVIGDTAFVNYTNTLEITFKDDAKVFYNGKPEEWATIVGEVSADYTVYYFSEEAPESSDVFWRFVDDKPVVWVITDAEA